MATLSRKEFHVRILYIYIILNQKDHLTELATKKGMSVEGNIWLEKKMQSGGKVSVGIVSQEYRGGVEYIQ
jgi:hypothetical protein